MWISGYVFELYFPGWNESVSHVLLLRVVLKIYCHWLFGIDKHCCILYCLKYHLPSSTTIRCICGFIHSSPFEEGWIWGVLVFYKILQIYRVMCFDYFNMFVCSFAQYWYEAHLVLSSSRAPGRLMSEEETISIFHTVVTKCFAKQK